MKLYGLLVSWFKTVPDRWSGRSVTTRLLLFLLPWL